MNPLRVLPGRDDLYSSSEAASLAGISYRQLDYWCRAGVLTPVSTSDAWGHPCGADPSSPGSGRHRRFTARQVAVLRACGQLARLCGDVPALTALVDAVGDEVRLPVTVAIDVDGIAHLDPLGPSSFAPCWAVIVPEPDR